VALEDTTLSYPLFGDRIPELIGDLDLTLNLLELLKPNPIEAYPNEAFFVSIFGFIFGKTGTLTSV
jgi:hypothetical protein